MKKKGAEGEAAPPALDENGQPIPPADGAAPVVLGEDGLPIPAAVTPPVEAVPEPEVIICVVCSRNLAINESFEQIVNQLRIIISFLQQCNLLYSHRSLRDHHHHLSTNSICRQKVETEHKYAHFIERFELKI